MHTTLSSIDKISKTLSVSHVLILDTGSKKYPMPMVSSSDFANFSLVICREEQNKGYAGGNNILLRQALGLSRGNDLIVVCNPDILPELDTLISLIQIHSSSPLVFAVSPIPFSTLIHHNRLPQGVLSDYSRVRFLNTKAKLLQVEGRPCIETVFLPGSFLVLKASLIRREAMFNEDYFMYLEEVELMYRMSRLGYRSLISVSDGFSHNVGQPLHHPRKTYYIARNSVFLLRSLPLEAWPLFIAGRFLKPFFLLGFIFIVKGDSRNIRASFHGFCDGLKGRKGINPCYHK